MSALGRMEGSVSGWLPGSMARLLLFPCGSPSHARSCGTPEDGIGASSGSLPRSLPVRRSAAGSAQLSSRARQAPHPVMP